MLIVLQHRSIPATNSNAYPYVLFNDNVPNIASRDVNASISHSLPSAMNGRMPINYIHYPPVQQSPTHNVINISSSDEDTQTMQPINLSRKRMLRDAATVVRLQSSK